MYKIKEKYKDCSLFIKVCMYILHFIGILIRGTLFILVKLIYRIFKLYKFEKIRDDVFLVKSSNLSHTFNFKRSPYFKKKYNDIIDNLKWYKSAVQVDIHNETNESDEILDEIMDNIDELVILTEKESMRRAFGFASRKRKKLPYANHSTDFLDFYIENELNGYNEYENDLNNLK